MRTSPVGCVATAGFKPSAETRVQVISPSHLVSLTSLAAPRTFPIFSFAFASSFASLSPGFTPASAPHKSTRAARSSVKLSAPLTSNPLPGHCFSTAAIRFSLNLSEHACVSAVFTAWRTPSNQGWHFSSNASHNPVQSVASGYGNALTIWEKAEATSFRNGLYFESSTFSAACDRNSPIAAMSARNAASSVHCAPKRSPLK